MTTQQTAEPTTPQTIWGLTPEQVLEKLERLNKLEKFVDAQRSASSKKLLGQLGIEDDPNSPHRTIPVMEGADGQLTEAGEPPIPTFSLAAEIRKNAVDEILPALRTIQLALTALRVVQDEPTPKTKEDAQELFKIELGKLDERLNSLKELAAPAGEAK